MTKVISWWLATLVAATALPAPSARAEIAVLSSSEESSTPIEVQRAAYDAIMESLIAANYRVMTSEEADTKLQGSRACRGLDCASSVLNAIGAHMLVALAVDSGEASTSRIVLVTLVDAEGRHVNGEATVEADVPTAARAAFQRAYTKWPARGGVSLRIEGEPAGATVSLNGRAVGVLPFEKPVAPGTHEVVIDKKDYGSWTQRVNVPPTPETPVVVNVRLERPGAAAVGSRRPRKHLLGGSLLMVAGGGVVAGMLIALSMRDCSTEASNGTCIESKEVNPLPYAAWASVGAISLIGGATWLLVGERKRKRTHSKHMALQFGPSTLSLRGSF